MAQTEVFQPGGTHTGTFLSEALDTYWVINLLLSPDRDSFHDGWRSTKVAGAKRSNVKKKNNNNNNNKIK